LSEKEKREMEDMADEDEPILFLPFPFTTKEVRQPPYKGSDPEWATFIAVNKDPQLQKDIKSECDARTNPWKAHNSPVAFACSGTCGVDTPRRRTEPCICSVTRWSGNQTQEAVAGYHISTCATPQALCFWVSREPVILCCRTSANALRRIIIDDDGIFWGDRPIDSLAASHLNTAIYPKAVALSVWAFLKSLAGQTAQDVAKALGFNTPPPPEATWQAAILNRIKEQGELGTTGKQTVKVPGQPDKSSFPVHTGISEIPGTPFSGVSQVDPRIQAALQAATVTFTKNWQPAKQPPSRGCIRVDGLVELQGKSAVMAVYVLGWYDPKQRKYMGVQTGLKHLIQLKQRPAGGG
jgi:hypothetical protein